MHTDQLLQIEERSINALTVLATMAAASMIICCFQSVVPAPILAAAAAVIFSAILGMICVLFVILGSDRAHIQRMQS